MSKTARKAVTKNKEKSLMDAIKPLVKQAQNDLGETIKNIETRLLERTAEALLMERAAKTRVHKAIVAKAHAEVIRLKSQLKTGQALYASITSRL